MTLFEKLGLITYPESPQHELYHYTAHEGLLGILNNDQIWVTDIEYLNDSTELCYTLDLAKEELHKRYEQVTNEKEKEKEKINCLLGELDSHKVMNISITCFTEERDLLSQWRAYGGKGSDYSIGFNSSHLIEQAKPNNCNLVKVEYDIDNQKKIMSIFIDESLSEDFNTVPGRVTGRTVYVFAVGGDFIDNLYSIAPCFKDSSFQEEREWRLISIIPSKDACFRVNEAMLVPYANFNLGEKHLYIKSITVGPNLHMALSIQAVKKLMSKYSSYEEANLALNLSQNIPVIESKIPYRDW